MNEISKKFLEAYKAALENRTITYEPTLSAEEWGNLLQLADNHHVLPMIYEAVYGGADMQDPQVQQLFVSLKGRIISSVMMQTMKTNAFQQLYHYLQEHEVHPLVVKGIICRHLYEKPDYRMSSDEDIWVDPNQFALCHELLTAYGMEVADPGIDIQKDYEVPYGKNGTPLYIEVHKNLFPPDSDEYGDLNHYFLNSRGHAVQVKIDGVDYWTLCPSDHLFYLICHAFKHFLHSGFGIRQVSDIVLFANRFGAEIDWNDLLVKCKAIHAELFAAALFQIGQKYMVFDPVQACYPGVWADIAVDETLLLEDLLDAGVFGNRSMSRKHSSTMTLQAVAAEKKGEKAGRGVMKSLFPSAEALESRYPYLKERKYLLPVAWMDRIWKYGKETSSGTDNSAIESIKIGEQRIVLLKKYGIIRSDE